MTRVHMRHAVKSLVRTLEARLTWRTTDLLCRGHVLRFHRSRVVAV